MLRPSLVQPINAHHHHTIHRRPSFHFSICLAVYAASIFPSAYIVSCSLTSHAVVRPPIVYVTTPFYARLSRRPSALRVHGSMVRRQRRPAYSMYEERAQLPAVPVVYRSPEKENAPRPTSLLIPPPRGRCHMPRHCFMARGARPMFDYYVHPPTPGSCHACAVICRSSPYVLTRPYLRYAPLRLYVCRLFYAARVSLSLPEAQPRVYAR